LGTTKTSFIFLAAILAVVIFLTVSKIDTSNAAPYDEDAVVRRGGLWQTVGYAGTLIVLGTIVYNVRTSSLANDAASSAAPVTIPAAPPISKAGAVASTVSKAATGNITTAQASAASSVPTPVSAPKTKLGDLAMYRTITQDTLDKLNAPDQSGATKRIADLETAWDKDQARLQPLDGKAWTLIDGKIDTVLRQLRASSPNMTTEKQALSDLLAALG
jgi:hypothetical protein